MKKVKRFYVVRQGMHFLKSTDSVTNPCGFWMDSLMDAERFDEWEEADKWAAFTGGEVVPIKETVAQGYAVIVDMPNWDMKFSLAEWDDEGDPVFFPVNQAVLFTEEEAHKEVEKMRNHPWYRDAKLEVRPVFHAKIEMDKEQE